MELIDSQHFIAWAKTHGIAPDERYQEPRCLVYVPDGPHRRFWEVPPRTAQVPIFISHMLDGMDSWSSCYLWPRNGWPHRGNSDAAPDQVYSIILAASGGPTGKEGAVRFEASEKDKLITAVFAALSFGWSVKDDFFIVPDHGKQFLQTDHHDVVHVNYAGESMIDRFVEHMAKKGFLLPDELPDETFKQTDWIQ